MNNNNRVIVKFACWSFILIGFFAVSAAKICAQETEEKPDTKLAKQAKVTMAAARATALRRAPGKVEDAELEKEKGKLVYSFDIRSKNGSIMEVWVDAKTGKVVHVSKENAADEAKEKAEEMKVKKNN